MEVGSHCPLGKGDAGARLRAERNSVTSQNPLSQKPESATPHHKRACACDWRARQTLRRLRTHTPTWFHSLTHSLTHGASSVEVQHDTHKAPKPRLCACAATAVSCCTCSPHREGWCFSLVLLSSFRRTPRRARLLRYGSSRSLATWSQDVAWVGYGFFLLCHHDYAYTGGLYVWWYL